MSEIAIASVLVQEWESPYEPPMALRMGTVFPQLHKPFFIEEQMKNTGAVPLNECEAKLRELQQTTFFLIDLNLFLQTHPNHREAKALKQEYQKKRKELMSAFATEHYPLSIQCEGEQREEPAPWEGVNG